jgi:DNA-binding transcriptional LysR family regulator
VRSGRITDSPHVVRKIADLERVVCASPAYLDRRGTPKTPADLRAHDCVVVAVPGLNRWPFRTRIGVDVIEIAARVVTDDAEAALRLAIEGAGIVRLADVIVSQPIRDGELVPVLTDVHHVEPFPLSAIYLAGRHRLPRVRVFLDFLTERFAHAPWRCVTPPARSQSS